MNTRNESRPLLRRFDSTGQITVHKSPNKRRVTISGWQDIKCLPKRRRVNSVALPTKFLLGGNITDPLNLKSLEDEEVNRKLNACTPASSPVPISQHRTQVQILIPTNIYDPLNLSTGEEIEFNIISPRCRKRKRNRRTGNRKDAEIAKEAVLSTKSVNVHTTETSLEESVFKKDIDNSHDTSTKFNCDILHTSISSEERTNLSDKSFEVKSDIPTTLQNEKPKTGTCIEKSNDDKLKLDKIVSPVVPQGSKYYKRLISQTVQPFKNDRKRWYSRKRRVYKDVTFKSKNSKFSYGSNLHSFHCSKEEDIRFKFFDNILFEGKVILDIGCNIGCVPSLIAEYYKPRKIIATDIDANAISSAKRHLQQHYNTSIMKKEKFPISFVSSLGPLFRFSHCSSNSNQLNFPHNITYLEENYVLENDEQLEIQEPEFDIILCLRVTKWIHLNWGDEGLKRSFKRMFRQLRCGGQLILEPQPWQAYAKAKKLTETVYKNYNSVKLKPDKFVEFLLSKEVGFTSCKVLGRISNHQRGYTQSLYVLTKMTSFSPVEDIQLSDAMSPIVFNDIEWSRRCEDEPDSLCDWESNRISTNVSPVEFGTPNAIDNSQYDLCTNSDIFFDDCYFFPTEFNATQDPYEQ